MNTRKIYKKIDRKIRYIIFMVFIVACVSFFIGNTHLLPDKSQFERDIVEKLELSTYDTPIIINEIYTGDIGSGDYIELYNNGPDILMNNWSLEIYNSNTLNKTYHFPTDWVFKHNYIVVIEENGNPVNNNDTFLFTGWDIAWGADPVACGLFYDGDDNKINIDWIQSQDHAGDVPSDAKWSEDTPLTLDNRWAFRTGDTDYNLASDWTTSTSGGSKGLINSGQIGYDHSPSTSSIKINEIFVGLTEWIELYNYGSDMNMTGWNVKIYDNAGLNTTYDFPDNWIFKSNHVVVLEEGGSASNNNDTTLHAEGFDFNWGSWALACGIFDENGVNVDWIQANSYNGTRPSHAEWVDDPTVNCSDSDFIYRTSDIDRDKASDWTNSSSGTRGALNPGQTGNYYLPDTSIVINEICTATPDYIEMYNYGPDRNMTGWYMEIYDENMLDVTFTFPDGWMFKRNTIVTLYDVCINNSTTTNRLNTTLNIDWSSTDPLGCGIFDDNGACVDWFQSSHHVLHLPPHTEWEQDIEIYLTSNYSYRISDIDTNEASDWEMSLTGSEGSLNPGQVGNRHSATIKDFLFHKNITIDSAQVNGTGVHDDFPVLISLIDTDLHYEARSDGGDIAFFQGTTKLDHEIELFNQSFSATEAQLVAWVRIPSLSSSTNTTFAMYYGNSSLCKQEHPEGVWDDQYNAVWHLNNDPLGTIFDSTHHDNDGAALGMTSDNKVNGMIDDGLDFDNVDDRVDFGNDQSLDITEQMTIEAWINIGSYGIDMEYILAKRAGDNTAYLFGIGNNGKVIVGNRGNWAQSTGSITQNVWHHVVGIIDGTDATICVDGEIFYQESGINPLILNSSLRLAMGARWETDFPNSDYNFNGIMDEVRISNRSHSTDWIATQYNNVNDPSSFYSVGSPNDPLPPTTNISYNSIEPNFVNKAILFSLSSDDGRGSGVKITKYRINGSSWIDYTGPFNLTGNSEGKLTIDYYSEDNWGNIELYKTSEIIYLDLTPPNSSIQYQLLKPPNYINTSTNINITSSDGNGSGIEKIFYKIDIEGAWTEYHGVFNLRLYSVGPHRIYFYSVDNVGNNESINWVDINLLSSASDIPDDNSLFIIIISIILGVTSVSVVSVISILIVKKKKQTAKLNVISDKLVKLKAKTKNITDTRVMGESIISMASRCMNNLMTLYGDENGCWYYSNPKIYSDSHKSTDGLMLNDTGFFKKRLTSTTEGNELAREIGIDPKRLTKIKAIQFIYTDDISERFILDKCENYQIIDTLLIIIGLKWPPYQYDRVFNLGENITSQNQGIIKVISYDLFSDIMNFKPSERVLFNQIIEATNSINLKLLKEIHDSNRAILHKTDDLIDSLKEKSLINEDFHEFFQILSNRFVITVRINVSCPICKTTQKIEIPGVVIEKSKQLSTVNIQKGAVCDHPFQVFVDKHLNIRGYQKVDFDYESEE